MLAIGVTFVLLLGEIDLGAGYTAGVCASSWRRGCRPTGRCRWRWLLAFVGALLMGALDGLIVARSAYPRSS